MAEPTTDTSDSATEQKKKKEGGIGGFLKDNMGMLFGGLLGAGLMMMSGGGGLFEMLLPILGVVIGGVLLDSGNGLLGGLRNTLFSGKETETDGKGKDGPSKQKDDTTAPAKNASPEKEPVPAAAPTYTVDETKLRTALTTSAERTQQMLFARTGAPSLTDAEKTTLREAMVEAGMEVVRQDPSLAQNPEKLQKAIIDRITQNPDKNATYAKVNAIIEKHSGGMAMVKDMAMGIVRNDLTVGLTENKDALAAAVSVSRPAIAGPAPSAGEALPIPPLVDASIPGPAVPDARTKGPEQSGQPLFVPPPGDASVANSRVTNPETPLVPPPVDAAPNRMPPPRPMPEPPASKTLPLAPPPADTVVPAKPAGRQTPTERFIAAAKAGDAKTAASALEDVATEQEVQARQLRNKNIAQSATINRNAAKVLKGKDGDRQLEAALNTGLGNGITVRDMLESENPRSRILAASYICDACTPGTGKSAQNLQALRIASEGGNPDLAGQPGFGQPGYYNGNIHGGQPFYGNPYHGMSGNTMGPRPGPGGNWRRFP